MSLKIGFVGVVRPLFKGDSPGAARRSLAGLRALGEAEGFEVVTPDVTGNDRHAATGEGIPGFAVSNLSAAEQAARQLADASLDFLLIQHTTFSTGDLLVPLLHAAKRVGVWALPEAAGGRGETGPLPLNALCGLNMTMSFLEHPAVGVAGPVKWFYGEAEGERFRARLRPTLAALRGLKRLEPARILQVGGVAPAFYGLEEMPVLPGVSVERAPLEALFSRITRQDEAAVHELANVWETREPAEVAFHHIEAAARLELALSTWAEEGRYDAVALRCWPEVPERSGCMACAAVGNLSAHTPTACEGDVMGALSMLALHGVSGEAAILMDLSDLDAERLLFWHCGNAPLGWAGQGGSRLSTHFNRDGVGVVRDMTLEDGPATGFRLLSGGRRAVVVSGTFDTAPNAGYDGVRGFLGALRWDGEPLSAPAFVANVLDHRLPHHLAFGRGEWTQGVKELCGWLGAEVLSAKPERDTL